MALNSKNKILVIGAGVSGMCFLRHFNKLKSAGRQLPEVVCYEKQSDWGGMWNYTWRTGTDEHGEPVHASQYRYLWSNGPKEALELPEYTFEKHYGKAIPSFPPREVLFDYLQGYWKSGGDLRKHIKFNRIVRDVKYDESTKKFHVRAKDGLKNAMLDWETFDMVLVASGHYSVPHIPTFPGIEKFPGRVMHSHDFRDANEFTGKRLLCIGSSYSAEDIAMQVVKYGAASVVCTWRTRPMGFKWPHNICERPLLKKLVGKTCHFKDGSTAEVDAIIMCTGYLHSYPFMEDNLRLRSVNDLYPPNLYKGTLWMGENGDGKNCGDDRLLYLATHDNYYTFTLFDTQALWACQYILGDITLPDKDKMQADWKKWVARNKTLKDCHEQIIFQGDYVKEWVKDTGYGYDVDVDDIFHAWEHHKMTDILTYRDQSFASKYTGTQSPIHHSPFMSALDDSLACFMGEKK